MLDELVVSYQGTVYSYPKGPTLPDYFVTFRQDGSAVADFGTLLLSDPAAFTNKPSSARIRHLSAHHVTGKSAGAVDYDQDVPDMPWHGRNNIVVNPFTIKRTPKQIVDDHLMFPFGLIPGVPVKNVTAKAITPMGESSVT